MADITTKIQGTWIGSWKSHKNGHAGKLICDISKTNSTYRANFRATFLKFLKVKYTLDLKVAHNDEVVVFKAMGDLGWWRGGKYWAEGTIKNNNFQANYHSKHDYGVMKLTKT